MPRRRILAIAIAIVALPLCGCGDRGTRHARPPAPGLRGAARGHDLLLVTVDTLRADRLGAWGYRRRPTSPAIDGLVASGVRFERAMAQRALTWPSLASVLTGLYPSGHGVLANGYELPDDLATLPLALAAAGYQTGAFLSNMCRANHRGWSAFACAGGADGKVTRRALEWIDGLPAGRPYLLWTHYFGAHPPYYNGGELATQLVPGYSGPLGTRMWQLDRVMRERLALAPRDLEFLDALYDAAVIGSDRHVGELLAGLRQRGRLERTVIVFLADHGEDLHQHHGYLYHACSVYQSALHVPLAFVAPGLLAAGGTVAPPVELIDVLPTTLDLLGLDAPAGLHGTSLLRYLERPAASGVGKPAYSEYDATRIRTVVAGDWKLVVNPDAVTPYCFPEGPPDLYPIAAVELYDLASDPLERRNVAAQHPEKVAELRELVARRFAGIEQRGGAQEVPEDLKRELEALGYVAD